MAQQTAWRRSSPTAAAAAAQRPRHTTKKRQVVDSHQPAHRQTHRKHISSVDSISCGADDYLSSEISLDITRHFVTRPPCCKYINALSVGLRHVIRPVVEDKVAQHANCDWTVTGTVCMTSVRGDGTVYEALTYYYYYLFNTPKQQTAEPKQYIQYNAKNYYKLLQINANRLFKTLPHSILYFSPRSYHQITVNIQLACPRIHVIFTSGCKPTHNWVVKHHQLLPKQ